MDANHPSPSTSDVYVVMYGRDPEVIGSIVFEAHTDVIKNSLSPTWDEEHCVDNVLYDRFYFELYNENRNIPADFLGHTYWTIPYPGEPTGNEIDISELGCNEETLFELSVSEGGTLFVSVSCDYNCRSAAVHVTSMEDEEETTIETKATFTEDETGVSGFVELDEDGKVLVDLDATELDTSGCSFVNGEVSLKYGIFNMWTYGLDDVTAKKGATECGTEFVGEMFAPLGQSLCSELAMDEVSYYSCKLGDLSGRFGVVAPDENKKIEIEGYVSDDENDDVSGFCKARLTPEALHQRSMVFMCNDEKKTPLFCAPFMIEFEEIS
eukprot:CAMPEP_0202688462 /NCGR_PEP_ID=MMETSP1385-20130828/3978_1 /ASSEMBLY_ACC=CAM_ASM_000861 /TAXON_ID=933848 /ORGANISM="Elphidium margaritaceum" /LENGTH=323 /DNA_ID=CAMNT_0049343451 /DNA_START=172 /DNA_END=1140 /DNA_ORIENTATION=+